jgi:hypothetical protein
MTTQLAAADELEVETVAGSLSEETIPLPVVERAVHDLQLLGDAEFD